MQNLFRRPSKQHGRIDIANPGDELKMVGLSLLRVAGEESELTGECALGADSPAPGAELMAGAFAPLRWNLLPVE